MEGIEGMDVEKEEVGETDSDDDVTTDSEGEEEEPELSPEERYALEREVVRLRKELSKSPNVYNSHVELIGALRKLKQFDQLQHARQTMHSIYPLSEELWLEWLRDEYERLSDSDEERERMDTLFRTAVKDYLSIDIWIEYIQFTMKHMQVETSDGLVKIRSVMEEAISHGGLHAAKGSLLWDYYRELELATYQIMKASNPSVASAQEDRLVHLYNRQLSVPLLYMNQVWVEYEELATLLNREVEGFVKTSYEKAIGHLAKISPLEEALSACSGNEEKAAVYKQYLNIEVNEIKEPVRIEALYERIVAELPLYEVFWADYCRFVDTQFRTSDKSMALFRRAVRNCPWSSKIWTEYMFVAEKYGKDHAFLSGLVEEAFNGGLVSPVDYRNVWLAFLEYSVRKCQFNEQEQVNKLREAFSRACEHVVSINGDEDCTLLQFWAEVEVGKLNDMKKAREVWSNIISQGHGKSAQWRLSQIQFERAHGDDTEEVRRLLAKSLNSVPSTDWPESIVHLWLQFERVKGDLQTMDKARTKCDAKMKQVNEEREKQAPNGAPEDAKSRKRPVESSDKSEAKKSKKDDGNFAKPKPKTDDANFIKPMPPKTAPSKARPPPGAPTVARPPPGAPSAASATATGPAMPKDPKDPSRHPRTVFVSNLDYKATEDDIRSAMSSSGTVTDLRLVLDFKQRSKGYCYVEFATDGEAKEALKRDREPLLGRPMFISPSEENAALKHPVFKYQASLEKNKLFVKGIEPKATKEEVEQLFAPFGKLKDVRIVTYRSGHSKGIAYVEYADDASASRALVKLDGSLFQGKELSVALSQPPPRRASDAAAANEPSLGAGVRTRKTQVSFLPSSLATHKVKENITGAAKSNADFRMLLNK